MFGDGSASSSEDSRSPSRRKKLPSASKGIPPRSQICDISSKTTAEDDTLDAFMTTIHKQTSQQPTATHKKRPRSRSPSHSNSSSHEEYTQNRIANHQSVRSRSPSPTQDSKQELYLEPTDFSDIVLPKITWPSYHPLPRLSSMSNSEIQSILTSIGATFQSNHNLIPIAKFHDLALTLPASLLGALLRAYKEPTPIQRLAIPELLSSHDLIAVAPTGSGKTIAYLIPLLIHVSNQPTGSTRGRGPVAIVLAPVRELALQIAKVLRSFATHLSLTVTTIVGGVSKYEQFKQVRDGGSEIFVATPGRFIDLLKMRACALFRVSFLILDEADRMLDMGFEPQVRVILSQIRFDAQKALFSATFAKHIRYLSEDILKEPTHISISANLNDHDDKATEEENGKSKQNKQLSSNANIAMVSGNITEVYVLSKTETDRETWLLEKLQKLIEEGLVIIFCQSRGESAKLANLIRTNKIPAACIHGETDHQDRAGLLKMFSNSEVKLLVTTDLSARGLDIADVRNVINYGCAKNWEWHVHRVGRTGRASRLGTAYTLVCSTNKLDSAFVMEAVQVYRRAHKTLPPDLGEIHREIQKERNRGQIPRIRKRRFRQTGNMERK